MKKKAMVIAGFPGIGKSTFTRIAETSGKIVLDSDSSKFSWLGIERHPDFPKNYIQHIKENLYKADVILVSSHKEVRDALFKNNIPHVVCVPALDCKDIYIENYKERGNNEKFVEMLKENWYKWLYEIKEEPCSSIFLGKDIYLEKLFTDHLKVLKRMIRKEKFRFFLLSLFTLKKDN